MVIMNYQVITECYLSVEHLIGYYIHYSLKIKDAAVILISCICN